jgi:hypothetical protein
MKDVREDLVMSDYVGGRGELNIDWGWVLMHGIRQVNYEYVR